MCWGARQFTPSPAGRQEAGGEGQGRAQGWVSGNKCAGWGVYGGEGGVPSRMKQRPEGDAWPRPMPTNLFLA